MGVPHINPYAGAKSVNQAILLKAMRQAQIPIGLRTKIGKLDYILDDNLLRIHRVDPKYSLEQNMVYMFWLVYDLKGPVSLCAGIFKVKKGICTAAKDGVDAPLSDPHCFDKVSGYIYLNRVH